jgi:ATP-dependent RNA helicase DDX24/MAK5
MLEKGHFEEVGKLMQRINISPAKKALRQNFIFSATLTMVHDLPDHFLKRKKKRNILKVTPGRKIQDLIEALGLVNPKVVDITQSSGTFMMAQKYMHLLG